MANKVEIQIVGNNVYAVNAIDKTKQKLGELKKTSEGTSNTMSNLGRSLVGAFSVYAVANYGKELLDLGNKVRGVENAFKRIDQGNYLDRLREATNGLIGDLELMQAATFAEKFKIPFDVLVQGMEFAQYTAIETGQSFEYMMQSFVTGTARQSEKILDNLGISAKTLREEIKKTGDFMTALGNIMDSELAKMRGSMDESILKSRQMGAQMENAWQKVGVGISYAFDWLTKFTGGLSGLNAGMVIAERELELRREANKVANERFDFLQTTFNLVKDSTTQYVFLTEEQKKALEIAKKHREEEQKKLEALRLQNEEYQHQLNKATRQLEPRGMQDVGGGVSLEMATEYYDTMASLSLEFTNQEIANWLLMQDVTVGIFDNMAGAALNFYNASGNAAKGWFGVYKGMAIATTAIATYQAAVEAYKSMVGIPIVGPGLAVAAAAAATAFGLSNIARIASMQPGGSFGGGVPSAAPSLPAQNNVTNNNNQRNVNYTITINAPSGFDRDPDKFAREIIYHLDKARSDGG